MNRFGWSLPQVAGIAVIGTIVLGGGVWALVGGSADDGGPDLPQELTKEFIAAQAKENPGKLATTLMDTMDREDLTPEQRRAARQNMREVWQKEMDKNVNEYFDAENEEQKNAILDRQLDEFMVRMQDMRKAFEERRAQREQNGERNEADEEARRRESGRRWMGQTAEERKERSESRNPDDSARRMAYMSAMMKRGQQRGIEMPRFGPGGGGGPGGGRGGFGGGRGPGRGTGGH